MDEGISLLIGRTVTKTEVDKDNECVKFFCQDGDVFKMYHEQDCCENVCIEEFEGELNDILNSPVLEAEEREQNDEKASESGTYTFYIIRTIKSSVTIRWYGSSNGWYSESVKFIKCPQ